MSIFYLRETEVNVAGMQFRYPDFEIRFNIEFDDDPEPNIGEIQIYNLSSSTIAKMKKDAPVILNSGYQGMVGNIISGTVHEVKSPKQGLDKITTVRVGDASGQWSKRPFKKTYQAGTNAKQIIADISNALGIRVGEITLAKNTVYKRGRTVSGPAEKILREIVTIECASKLYISNGVLYIQPPGTGKQTAFSLTAATGLVGTPSVIEKEEKGKKTLAYEVVALMNAQLQIGNIIHVGSSIITGFYRIKKAAFISDGNQHVVKMEVAPA